MVKAKVKGKQAAQTQRQKVSIKKKIKSKSGNAKRVVTSSARIQARTNAKKISVDKESPRNDKTPAKPSSRTSSPEKSTSEKKTMVSKATPAKADDLKKTSRETSRSMPNTRVGIIKTRSSLHQRAIRKTAINARQVILNAIGKKVSRPNKVKPRPKKPLIVASLFNSHRQRQKPKELASPRKNASPSKSSEDAKKGVRSPKSKSVQNDATVEEKKKSPQTTDDNAEASNTGSSKATSTVDGSSSGTLKKSECSNNIQFSETKSPKEQPKVKSSPVTPTSKIKIDLTGAVLHATPSKPKAIPTSPKRESNRKSVADKLIKELKVTPQQAQKMVDTLYNTAPKDHGSVVTYKVDSAKKGRSSLVKFAQAKVDTGSAQEGMSPAVTPKKAPFSISVGKAIKAEEQLDQSSLPKIATEVPRKSPRKSIGSPIPIRVGKVVKESQRGSPLKKSSAVASLSKTNSTTDESAKKVLIRCSVCGNLFEPGENFTKHKTECQNAHTKCKKCGKHFHKGNEFTEHDEKCTEDGQGITDDTETKSWDEIFSGQEKPTKDEVVSHEYKCMACTKSFTSFKLLREHEEKCGQIIPPNSNGVLCSDCRCAFRNRIFLSRHKTQYPGCPAKKKTIPVSVKVTLQKDGSAKVDVGATPIAKIRHDGVSIQNLSADSVNDDVTSAGNRKKPVIVPTTEHTLRTYGQQPGVRGLSFANDATEIIPPKHSVTVVKCPICNKMFKNLNYLRKHFDSFHNLDFDYFVGGPTSPKKGGKPAKGSAKKDLHKPQRQRGCSCLDCGEWLPGRLELNLHKRKCNEATAKKQHPCTLCVGNLIFRTRMDLYEHMRVEHSHEEELGYIFFTCVVCSDAFGSKQALTDHHSEAHGSKQGLLTHEITGEKSVQCLDCGNFYFAKNMPHHKHECNKKNTTKSYVCFTCDQAFTTRPQLLDHKRENMCGPLVCWQCQRVFAAQVDLLHHITTEHRKGGEENAGNQSPLLKFSGNQNVFIFRAMSPSGALDQDLVKAFDVKKLQSLLSKAGNNSLVVPLSEVIPPKVEETVISDEKKADYVETDEEKKTKMAAALCLQPLAKHMINEDGSNSEDRGIKRKATEALDMEPEVKMVPQVESDNQNEIIIEISQSTDDEVNKITKDAEASAGEVTEDGTTKITASSPNSSHEIATTDAERAISLSLSAVEELPSEGMTKDAAEMQITSQQVSTTGEGVPIESDQISLETGTTVIEISQPDIDMTSSEIISSSGNNESPVVEISPPVLDIINPPAEVSPNAIEIMPSAIEVSTSVVEDMASTVEILQSDVEISQSIEEMSVACDEQSNSTNLPSSVPSLLIPMEGDTVKCTQCNGILATMRDVASHSCLTANPQKPKLEKIETQGGSGVEWYVASV